jgi:hypothetical protein
MHVRFLLGPAGSGKTWRCLAGKRGLKTLRSRKREIAQGVGGEAGGEEEA